MGQAIIIAIATIVVMGIFSLFSKNKLPDKSDALKHPKNFRKNFLVAADLYKQRKYDEALIFFNNIDGNIEPSYRTAVEAYQGCIYVFKNEFATAKKYFELVLAKKGFLDKDKHLQKILMWTYYFMGGVYLVFEQNTVLAREYKEMAIMMDDSMRNVDMPEFKGYKDL